MVAILCLIVKLLLYPNDGGNSTVIFLVEI